MTASMPICLKWAATSASVSWRVWRVVVHSSILALTPSFSRVPSAPGYQPAASRISLALSRLKAVGVWSA